MGYKTKREKQAYKTGLLNGLKRKQRKKTNKGNVVHKSAKSKNNKRRSSDTVRNNPFGMSYGQMLREDEHRKRDLIGDFDYDSRGRIKGSYTADGFFEPD